MPEISIDNFFSESKAYLIAVNNYLSSSVNNLESPVHDVNALKDVLEKYHGFKINSVASKALPNEFKNISNPLINPTSNELLDFLDSIEAGENDRVIIYFACHGIAIDSDGNPEGYILASDATPGKWETFISMSNVFEKLNSLKCKHLLLILDCCYAGAFRWANKTRGPVCDVPKTIYFERFKQYANNKAWQVLTSSAHDQKAIDTLRLGKRDTGNNNNLSPFAKILTDALSDGSADLSYGNTKPDGVITATELSYYLQNKIFEQLFNSGISGDKQQLPMLFPIIDISKDQHGKGEFILINPTIPGGLVELKRSTKTNPYKGLETYSIGDAAIFYGRQRVLDGWFDGGFKNIGLIDSAKQYNMVVLAGPSGIGKSSLAKAGLLATFDSSITVNEIRPGKTPMSSNTEILKKLEDVEVREILLVDQYEELITACLDEQERKDFESTLQRIISKHLVIVTIRTDFESQFRESELLKIDKDSLRKYRFVVPPFLREEIEEIVVQPAVQEVLEFKGLGNEANASDKFIDRIVDDAFHNPGSLPLLSMALSEIYENKHDNNLLELVYDRFGGLSGILDRKATSEFKKLNGDAAKEALFKNLIYRMISFESGRISKTRIYTHITRMVDNDELLFDSTDKTAQAKAIAKELVSAGLLKTDVDENNQPFIEPSHDALLRSWGLLAEWLKQKNTVLNTTTQEEIQMLKSVSDISSRFITASPAEQKGYLKSWARHPKLLQVRDQVGGQLNKVERAFVNKAYAQGVRSKRITMLTVCIFVALIIGAGIIALIQRENAIAQAEEARNNLKSFQVAQFKEAIQNGRTYDEAGEFDFAKKQFDSAYAIYKKLEADPRIVAEAGTNNFQLIIDRYKLKK